MIVRRLENPLYNSNTWLLEFSNGIIWLIDAGEAESILSSIPQDSIVVGILLTHAHYDHIAGIPEVLRLFPSCSIYTNQAGKDTLGSSKRNLSFYHYSPLEIGSNNVSLIEEGDIIVLGPDGVTAQVIGSPGHHPSSLSFKVSDYLFTGDALIPGVPVVTKLPGGNRILASESKIKLEEISIGTILCPGHGLPFDNR